MWIFNQATSIIANFRHNVNSFFKKVEKIGEVSKMDLLSLASQYRESGELCRRRVQQLSKRLECFEGSETEKIILRRRIMVLMTMERDTIATSNYLANYYMGRSI